MVKLLLTSSEVRKALDRIFGDPGIRRVALVAFVGEGAEAYLPNPRGITLVCWPQPGSTDPRVIRRLRERGAKIFFSERLHMKLYWAKARGAIITSANLSAAALGSGGQKEIGVLVADSKVDIDRILARIDKQVVTSAALLRLDRAHRAALAATRRKLSRTKPATFERWYELEPREKWKCGWWVQHATTARAAKEESRQRYGISEPEDFISCRGGDYRPSDWILCARLRKGKVTTPTWMYVDFTVRVPRTDKKAYDAHNPIQAVQVRPSRYYPPPPFRIDARFRRAFGAAVRSYGGKRLDDASPIRPPARLIQLIHGEFTRRLR